jgi:hypothetical protein
MEIENMNYMDLTDEWEDPFAKKGSSENGNDWMMSMDDDAPDKSQKSDKAKGPDHLAKQMDEGVDDMADGLHDHFDDLGDHMKKSTDEVADHVNGTDEVASKKASKKPSKEGNGDGELLDDMGELELPWPTKGTFVQVHKATVAQLAKQLSSEGPVTVQKALRAVIESAVKQVVDCQPLGNYGPGPSPAPSPMAAPAGPPQPPEGVLPASPAPVALVAKTASSHFLIGAAPVPAPAASPAASPAGGPSPAPGPSASCAGPKVHVALHPGGKMRKRHMINQPANDAAKPQTVLVKITLFERPGNGIKDMKKVKRQMKHALKTGELEERLGAAITAITGKKPKVSGLKVKAKAIAQWDIQKCGSHMSNIVKSFTVHYTRRQVPLALYNECTNFMTKMSFSHDYVLDKRDAVNCRKATRSFAQRWKVGKKDHPQDFQNMCVRFCQAKFGNDAPQCHFAA